jgi:DNA polymerase-1
MRIWFDTEDFLIMPGIQAPPLVCVQWCQDNDLAQIAHVRDARPIVESWLREAELIVGHHVAFDLAVVCAQWPSLTELVFKAYDENRVTCTEVRQRLIDIARGRERGEKKLPYDLGSCSERAGGPLLDKNDPWRTRYGTLMDVPVVDWPAEALSYALKDAEATRAVWHAQEAHADWLVDQYRQARAAFWIQLMVSWGIATDRSRAEAYITQVQKTLDEDRALCAQHGLVRPDGTKDTKAAQAWMRRVCEEAGEEYPLTEGGVPSLSEEAVEEHGDYVLEAYQRYANANTRTKRAERLLNSPIQSRFTVLINTGRMSCSQGDGKVSKKNWKPPSAWGAQIQNPSKEKNYREVFCARSGHALVSIDYAHLELNTWSQVCIWLFGYSKMAESINAGGDQHTELAAQLIGVTEEEAYRLKKTDKAFSSGPRFFSKMGNFGYLANMSAATFCSNLIKQAVHSRDAKIIEQARNYTEEEAAKLKNAFNQKWPESQDYFAHFKNVINGGEVVGTNKFGKDVKVAPVTHFGSGRIRGRCSYTQILNSPFQGLASDLVKDAAWLVVREAYTERRSPLFGTRLVNAIHDELLLEVPLKKLHEASYRASKIMVDTGSKWCPDLKFEAEPAAMLNWSKDASTVHDKDGKLIPWEWRDKL